MLKKILSLLCMFCTLLLCSSWQSNNKVTICKKHQIKSRIVIPENSSDIEKESSVVLQKYLFQITGDSIEIISDKVSALKNDINIGRVNRPEIAEINFTELEDDGYIIRTHNKQLYIVGGATKGTLYGTYGFLEKILGCRMYTSSVTSIPNKSDIELSSLNLKEIPVFKYREIYYRDAYNPTYMKWHGLGTHITHAYGPTDWGSWCHTTLSLVSPYKYGKEHPEYFSLVNGKRLCEGIVNNKHIAGDVCLSSEGAFNVAYETLKAEMAKYPNIKNWSVSQQDNPHYCRCPKCMKAYEETGSTQGTIIPFANKMAQKFPDKNISVLAYWYSTKPPKGIKVEKNVKVLLCNIHTPRELPIEQVDSAFTANLKNWYKIHDKFIIWDYIINFKHLLAPFPNLRILQPNLQFFDKNGVTDMFEQGNREVGGEFCELRTYLVAKLLWNPYQDFDALMDDFLNGFYGKAGKYIREYIDLMHDAKEATSAKLGIYSLPSYNKDTFLSETMITKYYEILKKAQDAVKYDSELLHRVLTVKASVDYAVLEIARMEVTGPRGAVEKVNGHYVIRKDIEDLLSTTMKFFYLNGVGRVHEIGTTPMEYIDEFKQYVNTHLPKE